MTVVGPTFVQSTDPSAAAPTSSSALPQTTVVAQSDGSPHTMSAVLPQMSGRIPTSQPVSSTLGT